jgi:WD40 repeat protein
MVPSEQRLVRVNWTVVLTVLSAGSGETLAKLSPISYRAAFAGKRGYVATIEAISSLGEGNHGRVHLIDPSNGESRGTVETPFGLLALAVSPDLRHIAVAGSQYSVLILDADTLEEEHRFFAHDHWITALQFHPTKPLLATGFADHRVKIWEYDTGSLQQMFLGLKGAPMHLAFSPNGRLPTVDGMEDALSILAVDEDAKRSRLASLSTPDRHREFAGTTAYSLCVRDFQPYIGRW